MKIKLPKKVHYKHGAYYYVTQINGARKWINLGKTEPDMYRKLAEIKAGEFNKGTLGEYLTTYQTDVIPTKAASTQIENKRQIAVLRKVFGHMRPHEITPVFIYQFMDARGKTSQTSANREKALLSSVFSYLIRWGVVSLNPCKEVHAFTEKPRDRYVEDWEYKAVYNQASPLIQVTMELAVISGMRQGDILNIRLIDCQTDGIHLVQNKTGKKQIFEWTKDLRAVVKRAKKLRTVTSATHLISSEKGKPYASSGFKSIWQRTMNRAIENGAIKERFTFHDLRGKAASEHQRGDKLLGHNDPKTTAKHYQRKPVKVKPIR